MNKNKKLLIIIVGGAVVAILIVVVLLLVLRNGGAGRVSVESPSGQQSTQNDKEKTNSSLAFTMSAESLAKVNGVLGVTVHIETHETIDRVEYSIDDTLKATQKESPYSTDIDVKALALGKHILKGVAQNTNDSVIAEASVEFVVVTAAEAAKPGAPGGSTGGGSSGSGGGSTGGDGDSTPTPGGGTPTPPSAGWLLTSTNTGLAPYGLSCGSLPSYTGSGKPAAGTVISNKRVNTTLDLSNGNITIEKSCIRPTSVGQGLSIMTTTDLNNCGSNGCAVTPSLVTIRDSEIDGSLTQTSDVAHGCALVGIANMQRNYIHHTGSGICMYNTGSTLSATIEHNYVHQLRAFGSGASGSHNEAFTVRDFPTNSNPSRRMNIYNNRFDASSGNDTGAAFIQTYGDNINEVRFEGNLFEGQGYQLGMEASHGNIYGTAMRAINNRFSGTGYGVGYVTRNGLSYGWGEWRDNYLNNPSAANNQGAVAPDPS